MKKQSPPVPEGMWQNEIYIRALTVGTIDILTLSRACLIDKIRLVNLAMCYYYQRIRYVVAYYKHVSMLQGKFEVTRASATDDLQRCQVTLRMPPVNVGHVAINSNSSCHELQKQQFLIRVQQWEYFSQFTITRHFGLI